MMRAADIGLISARLAERTPGSPRPFLRIVASGVLCATLVGCGQRGPLYLPHLPPEPATAQAPAVANGAAPVVPIPLQLPSPQTRLLDGTPSTIIAAPEVSMPEAGLSTLPYPTEPSPAITPSAGGTVTASPPSPSTSGAMPAPQSTSAQ